MNWFNRKQSRLVSGMRLPGHRRVCRAIFVVLMITFANINCSDSSLPPDSHDTKPNAGNEKPATPLNVIFISIDDMNDWIEPLGGHQDAITPNMQELANRGITFTNAHTPAPACNPSRVALSTGLAPITTGVYANAHYPLRRVLPEADTIYQHFMREGYHVAGFGKLIHRDDNRTETWSEYDRSGGRPRPSPLPHHGSKALVNDIYRFFDWGPSDAPESEWGEYKATSKAIDVMNRDLDKPFFIAVGYRLPHLAWFAPRKYFKLYKANTLTLPEVPEDDLSDVPAETFDIEPENLRAHELVKEIEGGWQSAVHAYLATISFVDAQLGRLLEGLEQSRHRDNTVVVLWSDHGFHIGEKRRWRKFTLWEESTRVPLIMAGPEMINPGSRSDTPVSLLDMYPTLIELTGISQKSNLDGLSLVPLLEAPDAPLPREYVLSTTENGRDHSLRGKRWRYSSYHNGGEELYDHAVDSNEFNNLAADPKYADIKAAMAAELRTRLSKK